MDKRPGFELVPIFVIVFLACAAQAVAPVSPPESRFVWEPGENLTFTWTHENFGWFYYDAQSGAGKESLTIKLDNIKDRSIPKDGIEYSTTVETVTARYSQFGEYAVIGFMGGKYLVGFPEGKNNITDKSGINLNRLHTILIDDSASHTLVKGGNLTLSSGYVLEIKDVNVTGSEVTLSLKKDGFEIDTRTVDTGKNYICEIHGLPVVAVHIDSVLAGNETSVIIKGIFQISDYETLNTDRDHFGFMVVTNVSDTGITMRNAAGAVDLKPGHNGETGLNVADSDTLRFCLYCYPVMANNKHRGAMHTGLNNLRSWDGLNYAGFLYDIDSGNYSESLVITNMTGRRIPEGGLTYTSYRMKMPYAVTDIKGIIPNGTDGSYVTFSLGGNKYVVKSSGLARILIKLGDSISEKKTLGIGYIKLGKETWEKGEGTTLTETIKRSEIVHESETWELGEGYSLTAPSVNYSKDTRKARLVLKRNGVELDDVWLKEKEVYRYSPTEENDMPKLITYLDACFAGSTHDMIQFRYTWFLSDNVTQIKEGDSLGVFNVTMVEPDRLVLKNRVPIELKAGRIINLYGNLSFFVENSDELRFYPTNMAGMQVMSEEVTVNETLNITDTTSLASGKNERVPGFEVVIFLAALFTVYRIKSRKDE